jgi:hypothetical protein
MVLHADASALLRILFSEPGSSMPLTPSDRVVSSKIVAIEAFRAVDRERLLGQMDDLETAIASGNRRTVARAHRARRE